MKLMESRARTRAVAIIMMEPSQKMRRASERVDGAARVNAVSGKPYGDVSNDAGVENDGAARIHARGDYIYGVEWEPARSEERGGAV